MKYWTFTAEIPANLDRNFFMDHFIESGVKFEKEFPDRDWDIFMSGSTVEYEDDE